MFVGITQWAVSLVAEPGGTAVFDRAGRPVALHVDGFYHQRSFAGAYVAKAWVPGAPWGREVHRLMGAGARAVDEKLKNLLIQLKASLPTLLEKGQLEITVRGEVRGVSRVGNILDFLLARQSRWDRDELEFQRMYRPVGILPPDQYQAWVLQLTEGCPWNQCRFCDLYAGEMSRVKTGEEWTRHVADAASFFGASLRLRSSIFIGEANALAAPPALLTEVCRDLTQRFPRLALRQNSGRGGLYAFGEATRVLDWRESELVSLAQSGLVRVYLGVETGDDALRRHYAKPGTSAEVREAVHRLKSSGLSVGVIVLLGLGGISTDSSHRVKTAELLASLSLGQGDRVYYSPYMPAKEEGLALAETGMRTQEQAFRRVLPAGVRQGMYDLREFVY